MRAGKLTAGEERRHDAAPMRSPVNWALLGLIIERPSYAYDLGQRFERRYGSVLSLSNIGHVYTAIGALETRGLVQEIAGTREGRQPKPHYRATALGREQYVQWLIGHVGEDRRRHQLFVLQLAALAGDPAQLAETMARYEQAWLQEGMRTPIAGEQTEPGVRGDSAHADSTGAGSPDNTAALLDRLLDEENRLAVGAQLEWAQYAQQELRRLSARLRGDRGPGS